MVIHQQPKSKLYLGSFIFITAALAACGGESEATAWIKSVYSQSDIDWACSNLGDSAAGLDWYPEIGFSLQEMQEAWSRLCR